MCDLHMHKVMKYEEYHVSRLFPCAAVVAVEPAMYVECCLLSKHYLVKEILKICRVFG